MKTKLLRGLIAALVGGMGMWIIAGLWHNLILPSVNENIHAHHQGIFIMLIAYLILGFIMVYLFTVSYKGEKSILNGLKLGLIIGILWVFPYGLAMAGAHNTSIIYEIKNTIWHMFEQGIGGIIIASIYRNNKQQTNENF